MGHDRDCFINCGGLVVRGFTLEMDRVWARVGEGVITGTSFELYPLGGCLVLLSRQTRRRCLESRRLIFEDIEISDEESNEHTLQWGFHEQA